MVPDKIVELVIAFHGHLCPGLAIGIRAAELALQEMDSRAGDEELVAVVENDNCSVDAIQFMTGCTFGKGNLIFQDHGKNVYRFYRREDGKAIRIAQKADAAKRKDPAYQTLQDKQHKAGLSDEELERLNFLREERIKKILSMDLKELFTLKEINETPPQHANIYESVECEHCHELTMETRTRRIHGKWLCLPCYAKQERKI
ncbi:MAG: TraR/DksA C4-type zinc finger protein [Anaerolineaceae bacterium]|nr:TraR/DksA C4-type zinc finger protein [Anaerolineaceae bacterium]